MESYTSQEALEQQCWDHFHHIYADPRRDDAKVEDYTRLLPTAITMEDNQLLISQRSEAEIH